MGIATPAIPAAADDAAAISAAQARVAAKQAAVETLRERVHDCDELALNDYGLRLRTVNDLFEGWNFIFDAAAKDVVPMSTFAARFAEQTNREGRDMAAIEGWVRASHVTTRQVYDICRRGEFAPRLATAQRELADLETQLDGLASCTYVLVAKGVDPKAIASLRRSVDSVTAGETSITIVYNGVTERLTLDAAPPACIKFTGHRDDPSRKLTVRLTGRWRTPARPSLAVSLEGRQFRPEPTLPIRLGDVTPPENQGARDYRISVDDRTLEKPALGIAVAGHGWLYQWKYCPAQARDCHAHD